MTGHPHDLPRQFIDWTDERPAPPADDVAMTASLPVDRGRSYYLIGEPAERLDVTSIADVFQRLVWSVRRWPSV
jgi:hypothetical protein